MTLLRQEASCFCEAKVSPVALSTIPASVNWLSDKRYLCIWINYQAGSFSRQSKSRHDRRLSFKKAGRYGSTNQNFYGLLCEIAIEQDQEKDFLKYAGYTALADNSHQMRIKIYAKIADYLHKCGRTREEMLHKKLIANLQLENNWLQKKVDSVELPQDIADMSTKDVLKELKGFWQHWQDIGKVFQEGIIEKILSNGGSGFIRTDDNESYYFNFKDAKCNKQLLVPGNRMKFVLIDRMDRKKNTVKKNAVDIRLA